MRAESEENTALTNSCVHDAEGPGIEQPWQPLVDIIQIIAVSESQKKRSVSRPYSSDPARAALIRHSNRIVNAGGGRRCIQVRRATSSAKPAGSHPPERAAWILPGTLHARTYQGARGSVGSMRGTNTSHASTSARVTSGGSAASICSQVAGRCIGRNPPRDHAWPTGRTICGDDRQCYRHYRSRKVTLALHGSDLSCSTNSKGLRLGLGGGTGLTQRCGYSITTAASLPAMPPPRLITA